MDPKWMTSWPLRGLPLSSAFRNNRVWWTIGGGKVGMVGRGGLRCLLVWAPALKPVVTAVLGPPRHHTTHPLLSTPRRPAETGGGVGRRALPSPGACGGGRDPRRPAPPPGASRAVDMLALPPYFSASFVADTLPANILFVCAEGEACVAYWSGPPP